MRQIERMAHPTPLVTAEEFARIPDDDHRYELVEGRVVRMTPAGSRHGRIGTRLLILLGQHVDAHELGVVLFPTGFKLAENPDTVREPDVAFIRRECIPETGLPDEFWPGPPDLAVEIRSPRDRTARIDSKVADYLARGVRLVWAVNPENQTITAHRPMGPPVTLGPHDTLDGGDVVPGFRCTVLSIFE